LVAHTSSSRGAARAAVFFGALAVLTIPAAIVASKLLKLGELLHAVEIAVPVAFVLSLVALSAARRARYRLDRSVFREGARTVRLGRFLAWTGMYLALVGALSLAFYGALRWAS
jgi:hypothetical protein